MSVRAGAIAGESSARGEWGRIQAERRAAVERAPSATSFGAGIGLGSAI